LTVMMGPGTSERRAKTRDHVVRLGVWRSSWLKRHALDQFLTRSTRLIDPLLTLVLLHFECYAFDGLCVRNRYGTYFCWFTHDRDGEC